MAEKDRETRDINFSVHSLETVEDTNLRDQILAQYNALFDDDKGHGAQLQRCYTEEELQKVLDDSSFHKLVSVRNDGKLMGCCVIATNREDIKTAYANPAKFELAKAEGKNLWYVTALMATEYKTPGSTRALLEKLAQMVFDNNVALGYDYAEYNEQLPVMIEAIAQKYAKAKGRKEEFNDDIVGQQTYRLIQFK